MVRLLKLIRPQRLNEMNSNLISMISLSLLKKIFIIHAVIDILFAAMIFLNPNALLLLLGFTYSDPLSPRIVAAALCGIGGGFLCIKNKKMEHYFALLPTKIIWSFLCFLVLLFFYIKKQNFFVLGIFLIFFLFFVLWVSLFVKIKKQND